MGQFLYFKNKLRHPDDIYPSGWVLAGGKRPGSRGSRVDVVTLRDQMVCDQMRSKCLLRTDVTLSELFRGGET